MKLNQITALTTKRIVVTLVIIIIAAALRLWPLNSLGSSLMWLTFYPAMMIISIYGGLWSGLIATALICFFVSNFWFLIVAQPFINNPADWLGMIVFVITGTMISAVSESMRFSNKKAREAEKQAQKANLAKSAFLANMSHELRTPLNAILGYSQLMQREANVSKEYSEYLTIINRSGEHLLDLINDVLEISKIEAKRINIDLANFNLHHLILDLKRMFELKTVSKGLILDFQNVDEVPKYIVADETKLRIILINLLGNAVKFTETGKISVRFSYKIVDDDKHFLKVEVQDSGPGIAREELQKLFQAFQQTESGIKSKSGTGLGLAISQDYAKMMGGEILVTSSPGVGSTFTVMIKVMEGRDEFVKSDYNTGSVIGLVHGQKVPRILIAEDKEENRLLLVRLLKLIGFDIKEALNGKEAVEIAERWKPDFIWMDIRMPVMDGLEATRQIRKTEAGREIKIAALSAHVLSEERQEIFDAGCDDFAGKPFREKELFDIMQKHLLLEYIYAKKEENDDDKYQYEETEPTASDLILNISSLDADLREELKKAVESTDAQKIIEIANKIKKQEQALSVHLKKCAKNFDYEPIRMAFKRNLLESE